jgi:hypothetical protein
MSNNLSLGSKGLLRASSSLYTVGILLVLSLNVYNTAAHAQSLTASHPSSGTVLPTIQITSPQAGRQVPPGELTIQGISSDNEDTDCTVYADINDITPMQNVSAAGDSKKVNDFSKWSFTYTPEYQLIETGENELTAKITCLNERNPNADAIHLMSTSAAPYASSPPLSKWHTVNVTGVTGAPSVSPVSSPSPQAENTDGLVGEEDEIEESDEGEISIEEDVDSEEDIDVEDIDIEDIASEEDSSDAEGSNNDEQNDDSIDENSSEDDSDNSNEDVGDSFFSGDPFFD